MGTSETSSLISLIRLETKSCHAELEEAFNPFERIKTLDDYRGVLERFRSLYEGMLPLSRETVQEKLAWLERDLAFLGGAPLRMAPPSVGGLTGPTAAWAVAYVLEGSALGGQVISKRLMERFPELKPEQGLSFFYGHGPKTREKWMAFVTSLESVGKALSEAQKLQTASEAKAVFQLIHRHLCA